MDYDQPLDLSLPKQTSGVMTRKTKREKDSSLFDDIEFLVLPSSKKSFTRTTNVEKLDTLGTVDASKSVSLSADNNGLHINPLGYVQNVIHSIATAVTDTDKSISSVDETVSSSTGAVSHCVDHDDDDDDDSSVVSLDTPSLSGIDDELSMDEEVEAILAKAIKNSPKMLSPIKDLPQKRKRQLNEYLGCYQPNWNTSVTQSNSIAEICISAKHPQFEKPFSKETAESNQPEHSNGSNKQFENTVAMTTKVDTSEPLAYRTAYKSTIDFKDLEKLTINVGNRNSTRTVSLSDANPAAMVNHKQPVPQEGLLASLRDDLDSTRITSLSNANPTAMVAVTQPAPQPAPIQCNEGIHKVAVHHSLIWFQPSPPSTTQPVQIVQPIDSVGENFNIPSSNWLPDYSISPDRKRRYSTATMKLFEHPCINFLAGKPCLQPTSCTYYHHLPIADKVLEKMKTYPDDKIHFIYSSFISKNMMTFSQYFPMICYLLGIRKMKKVLVTSVKNCNEYKRYDFYKFIYGGLLMCGMRDWEAIQVFDVFADICEESVTSLKEIAKNPCNPFLS